jgi:hypothetical protein
LHKFLNFFWPMKEEAMAKGLPTPSDPSLLCWSRIEPPIRFSDLCNAQ